MMATSNSRICYHSPFQLGQLLNGTYRLTSRLGVGGSTEVFGAVHVRTKDEYALKVLRHDRPEWRARLRREYEILRTISHPGMIRCFERDQVTVRFGARRVRLPFIVLEKRERTLGGFLRERWQRNAPRLTRAVKPPALRQMFRPVLELLDELGHRAMCHRDIKPLNLVFSPCGHLQLIDFNLSHMAGSARLTHESVRGGSGRFASPEQRHCLAKTTPAADVYSVALCMLEAVTGHSLAPYHLAGGLYDLGRLRATVCGAPSLGALPAAGDRFCVAEPLASCLLRALSPSPRQRPSVRRLIHALDVAAHLDPCAETILQDRKPALGRVRGGSLAGLARPEASRHGSRILTWLKRCLWGVAQALSSAWGM